MDGGDNWYEQDPAPSVNYYDVHFVDTMRGWAVGSSTKIRHTEDGGVTWMAQDSISTGDNSGVFFVDAMTGWVGGGKARSFTAPSRFVNHTTNGGLTWTNQHYQYDADPLLDVFFIDGYTGWAIAYDGSIIKTISGGN